MQPFDDVVNRILSIGKSLEPLGSNNWALTRAQTLDAIDAIERERRVLLGGDVWLAFDSDFSITGDSWHFEPNPGNHEINVRESTVAARAYVTRYPERPGRTVLFELVVE